eukprot:jgi/Mesvir1/15476/Mv20016-RA.1
MSQCAWAAVNLNAPRRLDCVQRITPSCSTRQKTQLRHLKPRTRTSEFRCLSPFTDPRVRRECVCLVSSGETSARGQGRRRGMKPFSQGIMAPNGVDYGANLTALRDGLATPEERHAIDSFLDFLAIRSTSAEGPAGAYQSAVAHLQKEAWSIGLETEVVELVPNKPILICTLRGKDETLPSLLLNSHYDVVPADENMWLTAPFQPTVSATGDIIARGTQDMKCVCIQYLEAMRALVAKGWQPARSVHLLYVPDEEVGGEDGMGAFVASDRFRSLHVGAALDEGLASETDTFSVFYGERATYWLKMKAVGPTGHGSRFIKNTAMGRLINTINKFLAFRAEQEKIFEGDAGCRHCLAKKLGEVASVNLTMLKGGVTADGVNYAINVIPMEAEAGFDIRVPPSMPLKDFDDLIHSWAKDDDVTFEWVYKTPEHYVSSIDAENPWWGRFKAGAAQAGVAVEAEIFPAGTDSKYLRELGIPAFGFSPMNNTPILLHDHNERLAASVFLRGIRIYQSIITSLAGV